MRRIQSTLLMRCIFFKVSFSIYWTNQIHVVGFLKVKMCNYNKLDRITEVTHMHTTKTHVQFVYHNAFAQIASVIVYCRHRHHHHHSQHVWKLYVCRWNELIDLRKSHYMLLTQARHQHKKNPRTLIMRWNWSQIKSKHTI